MKNNTITIMGIDPGINNTGVNIAHYDIDKNILTVVAYTLIQANNLAKKEMKEDSKLYGNIVSLDIYERELHLLVEKYHPDYICCENSFYNPHMPNAYLSLSLCITSIRRMLYHFHNKTLYTIPPKSAKQCVCSGDANKLVIQEAIYQLPDLIIKRDKKNKNNELVEHIADSIAISYAFCKMYLPDMLLQNK